MSDKIKHGTVVYMDSSGEVRALGYSRFERVVRSMGRKIGMIKIMKYHEQMPVGIMSDHEHADRDGMLYCDVLVRGPHNDN